jgi:hypothetical protein
MSSKSIEDLINLVLTDGEEILPENDVLWFIRDWPIEASETERVPAKVIYWYYIKWKNAGNGYKTALTQDQFFKLFRPKFSRYIMRGDNTVYSVKKEKLLVTRWQMEEIRRNLKEEKRLAKQRKKAQNRKRKGT